MGSILKATLFGGVVSFICIILGFKFFMPINGQIQGFLDPNSVKSVLESNTQNSGLYMMPDVAQEEGKFSELEKNIQKDIQNKSFDKEVLKDQNEIVALIAIQKNGFSFASWQKLALLLIIQLFFSFEVSLITLASKVNNYFYSLLLNNLTGLLQISFFGLFLVLYLGFPSVLVSMVAIVFIVSWAISSIFTSLFTRKI